MSPADPLRRPVPGGSDALRFCHLTTFYPPYGFGGDGIGVQRLCRALARRGHHVTVVHDVDAYEAVGSGPPPAVTDEDDDGVDVVRLQSRAGALSPSLTHQLGRPVLNGRRIRRLLAEGAFDVIHFHNVSLLGGPGILRYGSGVKLYTAHEHWLVCPTHVLWRHNREPCTGRECLRCVLRHRRPPQVWRYSGALSRATRHVDAFIAPSEFTRAKHREFGFRPDMEVLPWFLPDVSARGTARTADRPHERPYFLYVGRLERLKGLDDVIPAFEDYQQADLLIAGEGEHGGQLRELAAGNPHVRFLGRLDGEQLDTFYRHAVALVAPSVGFETFGMVLIEAFRAGTPVIARATGPFPEIVRQADAGELFSTADDLVTAMRRLQSDPSLQATYAARGRDAFSRLYSEDVVVPRYLEIVRRAAEGRKGPTAGRPAAADGQSQARALPRTSPRPPAA